MGTIADSSALGTWVDGETLVRKISDAAARIGTMDNGDINARHLDAISRRTNKTHILCPDGRLAKCLEYRLTSMKVLSHRRVSCHMVSAPTPNVHSPAH